MNQDDQLGAAAETLDSTQGVSQVWGFFLWSVVFMILGIPVAVGLDAKPSLIDVMKIWVPITAISAGLFGASLGYSMRRGPEETRSVGTAVAWAVVLGTWASGITTFLIASSPGFDGALAGTCCVRLAYVVRGMKEPRYIPMITGWVVGFLVMNRLNDPQLVFQLACWGAAFGAILGPVARVFHRTMGFRVP